VRYRTTCVCGEQGPEAQESARLAACSLPLRVIGEDIVTRAAVQASVDRDLVADIEQRKWKLVRADKLSPVRADNLSQVCTDKLPIKNAVRLIVSAAGTSAA
jgi:hypothetical protein